MNCHHSDHPTSDIRNLLMKSNWIKTTKSLKACAENDGRCIDHHTKLVNEEMQHITNSLWRNRVQHVYLVNSEWAKHRDQRTRVQDAIRTSVSDCCDRTSVHQHCFASGWQTLMSEQIQMDFLRARLPVPHHTPDRQKELLRRPYYLGPSRDP